MELKDEEANIVIEIDQDVCWIIRGSLRPSMFWKDMQDGVPEAKMLMELREQTNSAILRFTDEPGLKTVTFRLTEMQAWALDTILPYDGQEGNCSETLRRLFRGMWNRSMGSAFDQIVQNPKDLWEPEPTEEEKINEAMDPQGLWSQLFITPPPAKPEESNDETKE